MIHDEEEEKKSNTEGHDPFSRLMFGDRSQSQEPFRPSKSQEMNRSNTKEDNQLNELLSNVNMEELMKNIDTIMSSASQFKPLLNKLGPLINKWIK